MRGCSALRRGWRRRWRTHRLQRARARTQLPWWPTSLILGAARDGWTVRPLTSPVRRAAKRREDSTQMNADGTQMNTNAAVPLVASARSLQARKQAFHAQRPDVRQRADRPCSPAAFAFICVHRCSSALSSCLLCHCAVLRSRAGPGSVPRRRPAGCKPHNMNDAGHILPLLASAQRFWPVAWWLPEPPDRPGEAFSRRAGSDPKRFIHATSRDSATHHTGGREKAGLLRLSRRAATRLRRHWRDLPWRAPVRPA